MKATEQASEIVILWTGQTSKLIPLSRRQLQGQVKMDPWTTKREVTFLMSLEDHILHPRDIMTGDVQRELWFGDRPHKPVTVRLFIC